MTPAFAAGLRTSTPLASASCPVCRTDTGAEVRAAILASDAGTHLLACVLPFLACAAIVAAIRRFVGRASGDSR